MYLVSTLGGGGGGGVTPIDSLVTDVTTDQNFDQVDFQDFDH